MEPTCSRPATEDAIRAEGMRVTRTLAALIALATVATLTSCGSNSNNGVSVPKILPGRTFALAGFKPSSPVLPGRTTMVSFTIRTPSGAPLTGFKKCCEPHAGVDLIIVRSDDSHVQYDDSDIAANGKISQPVVFPAPGRYRIVIDAYPKQTGSGSPFNFQLFAWVTVRGNYHPQPIPAYSPSQTVDRYRFQIQGRPHLKAIQANFLTIKVLDPAGQNAAFTAWRGALAHAIFFHAGSLDYFHTHVCNPGAVYCFSALGSARVTGRSSAPGTLKVGVLLPEPGTWRMFLLTYMHGRVLTVPYTLTAK
jgi:hypothetical protein